MLKDRERGSWPPRELGKMRAGLSPHVANVNSSSVSGDESDTQSTHLLDGETEAGLESVLVTEPHLLASLGPFHTRLLGFTSQLNKQKPRKGALSYLIVSC